jgi:hypothetical protein
MKYYFFLQYKRISRIIDEFGIPSLIGLVLSPFVFYFISNVFFERLEYANYLYSLIALILVSKFGEKNRNDFLKNTFTSNRYRTIRLLENTIISIPFFAYLIYKQSYWEALVLLIVSIIIFQLNRNNTFTSVIPTPFSKKPFEFIVGFRKTFWVFPIAYFLTYISISVGNFNLGIFSFLIVMLTTLSYYSEPEPIFYVWIYSVNSKGFLNDKIKTAIIFNLLLVAPIIIALLLRFSISDIDLIIIFSLTGILFVISNLLGKYSLFPSKIKLNQAIIIGLCVISPPMLLIIIPYFYNKSTKSLNKYLK